MNGQIAVLLPHYNNYNGLRLTLESLLKETEDFTLFIVEDGSEVLDEVKQIVDGFSNQLDISLIVNEVNLGIVKALNKGLGYIISLNKYHFVARIDAGDVCLNDRLKKQKEVLLKNNEISMVGSWVRFVDMERNKLFDFRPPMYHNKLKRAIRMYNPFVHSAVMYKLNDIKEAGLYPEDFPALEDHACFFNILKKNKAVIIPEFLMEYEVNPNGISIQNRGIQTKSRVKLLLKEYDFTVIATIGVLRAILTYILPQSFLIQLKKGIFYK